MSQLAGALEPVVDGNRPQHAVLTGTSGADLYRPGNPQPPPGQVLDVHTARVDCWIHNSEFLVLYKLLESVGTTYDIHRSTPLDELLNRLAEVDKPYLLSLDEADQLEVLGLLRWLYSIPQVMMILITNQERDLFDLLDNRLQYRLRGSKHVASDATAATRWHTSPRSSAGNPSLS